MVRLGVNIDHVATLRQARGGEVPSVLQAAFAAEANGADGITVHLREDRRHIQDNDVLELKEKISTRLNLEMSLAQEIVAFACLVKPFQSTLVPEKREELTTEGGLDVVTHFDRIKLATKQMQDQGIEVSLFIDPDRKQIECAQKVGATCIELHTGDYANTQGEARQMQLDRLHAAAKQAHSMGLTINAGHGLDYENVKPICSLTALNELNIGHAIICRSVFVGLAEAVREMKTLLL